MIIKSKLENPSVTDDRKEKANRKNTSEYVKVNIRMPKTMWDDLAEMAEDNIGNTRTSLILQAIDWKLKEWKKRMKTEDI